MPNHPVSPFWTYRPKKSSTVGGKTSSQVLARSFGEKYTHFLSSRTSNFSGRPFWWFYEASSDLLCGPLTQEVSCPPPKKTAELPGNKKGAPRPRCFTALAGGDSGAGGRMAGQPRARAVPGGSRLLTKRKGLGRSEIGVAARRNGSGKGGIRPPRKTENSTNIYIYIYIYIYIFRHTPACGYFCFSLSLSCWTWQPQNGLGGFEKLPLPRGGLAVGLHRHLLLKPNTEASP